MAEITVNVETRLTWWARLIVAAGYHLGRFGVRYGLQWRINQTHRRGRWRYLRARAVKEACHG